MSIFHSMVSRRDFMKFMGVTTAGLGAAALAMPAFHDIDEMLSSTNTGSTHSGPLKRPWFVKERDLYNPTVECDWTLMKRRDPTVTGQIPDSYYGTGYLAAKQAEGTAVVAQRTANNDPGYTARQNYLIRSTYPFYASWSFSGSVTNATWTKGGGAAYAPSQSPAERGQPKWTGTPEEGAKLLYAVQRYAGQGIGGYGEMDTRMRTQIISKCLKHTPTRPIVFEDTPWAYSTADKFAFPNTPMWYWSSFVPGTLERGRGAPSTGQQGASQITQIWLIKSTENFLRYIGDYHLAGSNSDDDMPFVEDSVAALSGVGELSRQQLYLLTPEYGCMARIHSFVMDMPVAPTKPIDAGLFRFCHTCHKCANNCPPAAISQEKQPSWDIYPATINGKPNISHSPGTKEFWNDTSSCMSFTRSNGACFLCWGNCTFTVNQGAMIHEIVKGTVSETSLFNGFLWRMGESFGYGPTNQKAEDWWDLSLPVLGTDTSRCAMDGGYAKWWA